MRINIFGDFVATGEMPEMIDLRNLLSEADYNVVNFEAPIRMEKAKQTTKSGPSICQNEKGPKWLLQQGFNIFTLANNHAMDYGIEGLKATVSALGKEKVLGAGTWEDAYKPFILKKDNVTVALLALTHCEFGTLTDEYDKRNLAQYGTAWINHPKIDGLIVRLKGKVDYVIVLAHAGVENIEQPLPEWRDRYKSMIDLGCDAVIASHPHIIQGYEEYQGKPIFYSLGNFFFQKDKQKRPSWYYNIVVSLDITDKGLSYIFTPLVFDNTSIKVDNNEYVRDYMKRILTVMSEEDKYIEYVNKKCRELSSFYDYMFYASGYFGFNSKLLVKRLIMLPYRLIKKTPAHLMNNIRCESHRWAILRNIKNRNNIQ